MSRGLGINKDLEPLARRVRRLGGSVEVDHRNHVVWVLPGAGTYRTGLTMSGSTARRKQVEIQRALERAGLDGTKRRHL